MGWNEELRAIEAATSRAERAAQKKRRQLDREAKEQAKLSEQEHAQREAQDFEQRVQVLLSVHKEQGRNWDWHAISSVLPAPPPARLSNHEFRARQQACFLSPEPSELAQHAIDQARALDEQEHVHSLQQHTADAEKFEQLRGLARRILAGDAKAYTQALVELSPIGELYSLGSSLHFVVHERDTIECLLKVKGTDAIPSETKSLTSTGKLSVKPMPKARFHELYQDYLCSCILRIAREVFALLPVRVLLVTASADVFDSATGHTTEQPVLSVVVPAGSLSALNFDLLDPSDAIATFVHRGDFKATRKAGAFARIIPLSTADLPTSSSTLGLDVGALIAEVRAMRSELLAEQENL